MTTELKVTLTDRSGRPPAERYRTAHPTDRPREGWADVVMPIGRSARIRTGMERSAAARSGASGCDDTHGTRGRSRRRLCRRSFGDDRNQLVDRIDAALTARDRGCELLRPVAVLWVAQDFRDGCANSLGSAVRLQLHASAARLLLQSGGKRDEPSSRSVSGPIGRAGPKRASATGEFGARRRRPTCCVTCQTSCRTARFEQPTGRTARPLFQRSRRAQNRRRAGAL